MFRFLTVLFCTGLVVLLCYACVEREKENQALLAMCLADTTMTPYRCRQDDHARRQMQALTDAAAIAAGASAGAAASRSVR